VSLGAATAGETEGLRPGTSVETAETYAPDVLRAPLHKPAYAAES